MPIPPINKPQTIEELRKRHDTLNTERITAEANLTNATRELTRLKEEAKAQWGTDDLEELKNKLRQMEDENVRLRSDYQAKLDGIEAELKQVDDQFKQAAGGK